MICSKICGFSVVQSESSLLETVKKSDAKKTPFTPLRLKRRFASGDTFPSSSVLKSAVPLSSSGLPGKNFRLSGLGVPSVWMNRARRASRRPGLRARSRKDERVCCSGRGRLDAGWRWLGAHRCKDGRAAARRNLDRSMGGEQRSADGRPARCVATYESCACTCTQQLYT